MRLHSKVLASAALALAQAGAGCDSGTTTPTTPGTSTLEPPAAGEGVQYSMTVAIQAGKEFEKCKFFQVGSEDLWVNTTDSLYTEGSHHMLLFLTSYKSIPTLDDNKQAIVAETADGSFDCSDGASARFDVTNVIAGAQTPTASTYDLPDDVAIKVPAGSVLILNTHYLNATPADLEAEVYVNLRTIAADKVKTQAGILFWYNPFIHVPAGEEFSAEMVCPIHKDITIVNSQSHMHKRGVGYEAYHLNADLSLKSSTPIYKGTNWAAPEVKVYPDGGLKAMAGEYIKWRCDYKNTDSTDKFQGNSANDEMCMFVGPYYPYHGPTEYCAPASAPDPVPQDYWYQGGWSIGHGTDACAAGLTAISTAASFDDFQMAVTHTCDDAGLELKMAYSCMFMASGDACKTECADQASQACNDCVNGACAAEFGACAAKACTN